MRYWLALVAVSILCGQTAPQAGSVSGTVVSGSGEPLRKAEVMMSRNGGTDRRNLMAITDSEGRFSFSAVQPGSYVVMAQRVGYIPAALNGRVRSNSAITVAPGQDVTGVMVRLLAQAVITGKVVDEDGDPLQHVAVQVASFRVLRGKRQLVSRGSAQTNDIGEYRIANLMPGKYYLFAVRQGNFQGLEAASAVEEGYPTMFYPNATDYTQATALECTAGNEMRGIDFRLRRVRTFHIRGQITDFVAQDKAGPHFAVYAMRSGGGFGQAGQGGGAQVRPDGAFDLGGLTPGSYTVVASRMVQGYSTNITVPVELGNRNVEGISITIGDGVNLKGTLKAEGSAEVDLTRVRVMLDPVDNILVGAPNSQPVKADGTFAIVGASAAKYRISAYGLPQNYYVKSVRVAQQEALETALDLANGNPGDIEILLSDKAARLAGTVTNDKQQKAGGVIVALLADGARRGLYRLSASTDDSGSFTVSGVIPGEYIVFALDGLEDNAWEDPEFLQKNESKGTKIKLAEGAAETLQLVALTPERVSQ